MLNAPRLWYRKVDDTFAITSLDPGEAQQNLNSIDENIKFTMKKTSKEKLLFQDYINAVQYTHFSSKQPLHVKLSTIKILVRREKFVCSDQTSLNEEVLYIRKTMQLNGYPLIVLKKITTSFKRRVSIIK